MHLRLFETIFQLRVCIIRARNRNPIRLCRLAASSASRLRASASSALLLRLLACLGLSIACLGFFRAQALRRLTCLGFSLACHGFFRAQALRLSRRLSGLAQLTLALQFIVLTL